MRVSGAWWMRPKRAVGKGKPPRTPGLRAGVEAAHEHVAEAVDVRLRGLVQVALDVELAPAGDGAVHVVEVGRQRRRPEDDALPPRFYGGARARPAAVEARGPLEDGPVESSKDLVAEDLTDWLLVLASDAVSAASEESAGKPLSGKAPEKVLSG